MSCSLDTTRYIFPALLILVSRAISHQYCTVFLDQDRERNYILLFAAFLVFEGVSVRVEHDHVSIDGVEDGVS